MTQYPHLANFNTTEGHWQDRNLFRPIIQDIYNKYNVKSILEIGFNIGYSASMWLEFDYDKKSKLPDNLWLIYFTDITDKKFIKPIELKSYQVRSQKLFNHLELYKLEKID